MESSSNDKYLVCSNCFKDEGLRIDAFQIGIDNNEMCCNCGSSDGHKLTKSLVRTLCYRFFVRGTIHRTDFGGFPLIQMNEQHFKNTDIDVSPWLLDDVKLIENTGEIGLFYYGPRFWMFGEIEPLKSLQKIEERNQMVETLLEKYPVMNLTSDDKFYRLRKNPTTPYDFSEFDSAPDEFLGDGRFDIKDFPILYGSQDLDTCIHECRATVEDDIFVSTLKPKQTLKLLNLAYLLDEDDVTEFESIDIAIHFLFLAGKNSYEICRTIAKKAFEKGFDGIIYPSFFSYIRTGTIPFDTVYGISIRRIKQYKEYIESQTIPNLALFGRPVKNEKIDICCINKVLINRVIYDTSFGPAYHKAFIEENEMK